jgi:transposase
MYASKKNLKYIARLSGGTKILKYFALLSGGTKNIKYWELYLKSSLSRATSVVKNFTKIINVHEKFKFSRASVPSQSML